MMRCWRKFPGWEKQKVFFSAPKAQLAWPRCAVWLRMGGSNRPMKCLFLTPRPASSIWTLFSEISTADSETPMPLVQEFKIQSRSSLLMSMCDLFQYRHSPSSIEMGRLSRVDRKHRAWRVPADSFQDAACENSREQPSLAPVHDNEINILLER